MDVASPGIGNSPSNRRMVFYNNTDRIIKVEVFKNDDTWKIFPHWAINEDRQAGLSPRSYLWWDNPDLNTVQVVFITEDAGPANEADIMAARNLGYLVTDAVTSGSEAWVYLGGSPGNWDFRAGRGNKYRVKMSGGGPTFPFWIDAGNNTIYKGKGGGLSDVWPANAGLPVLGQPAAPAQPDGTLVEGSLRQVSAGSYHLAWGVNGNDEIYRYFWGGGDSWEKMPGAAVNVSVAADGTVWCVNRNGTIYRWNGGGWTQINGSLTQVSVGSASLVWGVNGNDEIYRWQGGDSWTKMPGAAVNVSVAADGTVWCVNRNGIIHRWNGEGWTQISGSLRQVSVGSASFVWGVNGNEEIYRWEGGDSWTKMPGLAVNVSVSANGTVWGVTRYDMIYRGL